MNQILDKAMEKVKTFFSGVVSHEEIEALKQWVKLAETPTATNDPKGIEGEAKPEDKKEEVKMADVKTKDGKTLSIEGEIAVGSPIKEATPDGLIDLADGDYILVDDAGKELSISVMGGLIAEIATPQEEAKDETEVPAEMKKMETQMSEQKAVFEKELNDTKAELNELKKQVVLLSNHLTKILETPVNTVEDIKVDVSKMSALEYRQYLRSLDNN